MAETYKGTCFCGAVAIEAAGAPLEMGYCHCRSCRSHSGGPVNGFTLWKADAVKVTKGAEFLGAFNKTGFSNRRFCTKCGGHVMVDHPSIALADVFASTLPALAFKPRIHLNYAETVLRIHDGKPKLKDFPAELGGSGISVPE